MGERCGREGARCVSHGRVYSALLVEATMAAATGSKAGDMFMSKLQIAMNNQKARKLLSNHVPLLRDVTNPARWTNVEGKPLTQPEIPRVHLASDVVATYVDEALGYTVAALGFYCQLTWGFGLPFPFNIVMLPMDLVEWYIRWTITSDAPPA